MSASLTTYGTETPELRNEIGVALVKKRVLRRRDLVVRLTSQIVIFAAFLATWEAVSRAELIRPVVISRPSLVIAYLAEHLVELLTQTAYTLGAALGALVLGAAVGITGGIALGLWSKVDRVLEPFMTVLASLPRIALAPLFLIWFGITVQAKILLAFSLVVFILFYNTRNGVRAVSKDWIVVARLLGKAPTEVVWRVIIPATMPSIFSGLKLGVIYSLLGVIASEMVAARDGIGLQIVRLSQSLQADGVFAALTVIALVAWLLGAILDRLEKLSLRWLETDG